ncbi:hypothetical protein [Dactylosporangium sp. CA-233914]|uniref:hypothetical protein n=1 Tax=Dactylosporangium sp. CA-233914 TaxID=3239934 RepID=UPI003D8F4923
MVDEPTWIVLIRDVSHAVRIEGESCVVASLVLDAGTGLVRGMSVERSGAGACARAMRTALTQPAGDLPPQRPIRVLCGVGHREPVAAQLAVVLGVGPLPEVTEVLSTEAEDVFDSFVGHMAGRAQPEEFADPGDWAILVAHADTYRRAAPWRRWTDQDHFDLVIRIDDTPARYVTIVIGAEGVQRGLVLYPGGALPDTLVEWRRSAPTPVPAGSILFYLDPPADAPQEFRAKATRYGWPADADLTPVWLTTGQHGPADLDRTAVQRLTVAIAAILAHDRQPGRNGGPTTGTCALSADRQGTYTLQPPH